MCSSVVLQILVESASLFALFLLVVPLLLTIAPFMSYLTRIGSTPLTINSDSAVTVTHHLHTRRVRHTLRHTLRRITASLTASHTGERHDGVSCDQAFGLALYRHQT